MLRSIELVTALLGSSGRRAGLVRNDDPETGGGKFLRSFSYGHNRHDRRSRQRHCDRALSGEGKPSCQRCWGGMMTDRPEGKGARDSRGLVDVLRIGFKGVLGRMKRDRLTHNWGGLRNCNGSKNELARQRSSG
jgi:hypothetical protein